MMQSFKEYIKEHSANIKYIETCGLSGNQNLFPFIKEEITEGYLDKTLISHYNKYNKDEIKHIKNYTKTSSKLNSHLWENRNKPHDKSKYDEQIKHLDRAIDEHRTPGEMHVYTGLKKHPASQYGKIGTGEIFHHPAYLSTSLNPSVANAFASPNHYKTGPKTYVVETHKLKIKVPANHPGAYVNHISSQQAEKEFILPRNTKLSIHPNPKIEKWHTTDNKGNTKHYHSYTWDSDILPSSPKPETRIHKINVGTKTDPEYEMHHLHYWDGELV